ncbi:uncharacterized protein LOC119217355 isoform X1 [Pungitius pungitius]|uniref:uncharacterized protein LOC119217355 isoform X1 n=1 Tax=Pungitius pungitius TaxID=134920 RepID=UPI001888CF54|nr:uncharacterized protein LOC119217355 isoform X1 [Pungitius pungitius]XP_037326749.1 uncharacterized protein LOC119217355 isoform X1 [Pungitius pungitius]XP_037326750.1 uncharacterized protein LOC119217355 isoform X1 [Pungitius pungitius]
MLQNGMNHEGRRGGGDRASRRGPGLVSGGAALNGGPAAQVNGAQPPSVVKGDVNHWYRGKKAAPPRTPRKRGGPASAVNHASAAGGVRSASRPAAVSKTGAASPDDAAASPVDCQQMAPQVIPSATAKNQRRREKFRQKRNLKTCPENHALTIRAAPEEEDWEKESQEVAPTDWENDCYGINPYGPQDVIHFSLRDSPFQQRHKVPLLMASYNPAAHHPHPVYWRHYHTPIEQGQFADADH